MLLSQVEQSFEDHVNIWDCWPSALEHKENTKHKASVNVTRLVRIETSDDVTLTNNGGSTLFLKDGSVMNGRARLPQ